MSEPKTTTTMAAWLATMVVLHHCSYRVGFLVGGEDMDELNTTENKDLPHDQYQCWNCGGIFNKGWSDEQAAEELRNRMPVEKLEECAIVCDDCYNKMIIIGRDIPLETDTL